MTQDVLLHFGSIGSCIWADSMSLYCNLIHLYILRCANYQPTYMVKFLSCQDGHKWVPRCIRGRDTLSSTYSCLAVREMAGSWLCLVSSPCCWRWSRSDCGGSGPPRGARGTALWAEGTGLPFFCSGLCPPWKSRVECVGCHHLKHPKRCVNDKLAPLPHLTTHLELQTNICHNCFSESKHGYFSFFCANTAQRCHLAPRGPLYRTNNIQLWILCVKTYSVL